MQKIIKRVQEFSLPLIFGVITALFWSNISPHSYHHLLEKELFWGVSFHFLVNDIFMVFFFALAGVEITQSLLPGGALNSIKRAINPLFATLGGILGPVSVYLILNGFFGSPELFKGWGIPTATDIALAWLVARFVFGVNHPAVKFLLLLAIADDAIGLLIIAVFYPDPLLPTNPAWLLLTLLGVVLAYIFKKRDVKNYWIYLATSGILSWIGLHNAHLHPALALVVIIPFLPHPHKDDFKQQDLDYGHASSLIKFEHDWKIIVDFGLFFFGLANAGVELSGIGTTTWLVFISLLAGKIGGIFILGTIAVLMGFALPNGMKSKELFLVGVIASLGLTVALFVAGAAFTNPEIQGAAKMGALFSSSAAVIAIVLGRVLKIEKIN